jgi:hypothetical protein
MLFTPPVTPDKPMLPAHHKPAVAFIKKLKATSVRQELSDGAFSGLYLVVQPQPSGAMSWAVRTKLDGKSAKITLGRFDDVDQVWNGSTALLASNR